MSGVMCHSYLDFSISPFVGKKTPFADLSFFLTIFDDILATKIRKVWKS